MPVFSMRFDSSGVKSGATAAAVALKEVHSEAQKTERAVNTLGSTFKSAAQSAAAAFGMYKGLSGIVDFVKQGIAYNEQLENAQLGIASIIASTMDVVDAQGKMAEGAEKFTAAQAMSVKMAKALDAASVKSPAEYTDLLSAYQTVLAPATQLGLTWKESLDTIITMSNVLSSLNVPMDRLASEMQMMMTGRNLSRSAVAPKLGLTASELASWRQGGQFVEKFNERMQQFVHTGEAVEDTLTAIRAFFTDVYQSYAAETGKGLFDNIKNAMNEISGTLYTQDSEGIFHINEEIKDLTALLLDLQAAVGGGLESGVRAFTSGLKEASAFIGEYREGISAVAGAVPTVVTALGTWVAINKIVTSGIAQNVVHLISGIAASRQKAEIVLANAQAEHVYEVALHKAALAEREKLLTSITATATDNERAIAAGRLIALNNGLAASEVRVAQTSAAAAAASVNATRAAVTATGALRAGLSGLLGMLGGPFGIGIMAASAGIGYFLTREKEGEEINRTYAASLDAIARGGEEAGKVFADAAESVSKMNIATAKLELAKVERDLAREMEALDKLKSRIEGAASWTGGLWDGISMVPDERLTDPFNDLIDQLRSGEMQVEAFKDRVRELGAETGRIEHAEKLLKAADATDYLHRLQELLTGQIKKAGDAAEALSVKGRKAVEAMDPKEAIKNLRELDDLFVQLSGSAKEFSLHKLSNELKEFEDAIKTIPDDLDRKIATDKLELFAAGAKAAGMDVKTFAREMSGLEAEIKKASMTEAQYAEYVRTERVQSFRVALEEVIRLEDTKIAALQASTAAIANYSAEQVVALGENAAQFASLVKARALLTDLLKGLNENSGKMFGGGSSKGTDALKRIKDELASLTMSERDYAAFKLEQKYADLRKEVGRTTPEIQKLYEIEKLALDSGFKSASDMASAFQNIRKAIENDGLTDQQIRIKELDQSVGAFKKQINDGLITDVSLEQLDKFYESQKKMIETGVDLQNYDQIVRDFNREYQEAFRGSADVTEAVTREIKIYEAALAKASEQGLLTVEEYKQALQQLEELKDYKILQSQTDLVSGLRRGYQNYVKDASNAAASAEQFMANSFQSMEDALVSFVQTGKLDFKSLADSIIADLIRISIRMAMFGQSGDGSGGLIGTLISGIGSIAGSFFGGGGSYGSGVDLGYDFFGSMGFAAAHKGGVAGIDMTGIRAASPAVFAGASRFHGGGVAGLFSDEVPAILKKGEPVLTPAQARTLAPVNEIAAAMRAALRDINPGGAVSRVTVNVQNNSKAEVETQESQDGKGNFSVDLLIRDVERGIAKNINNGSSPVSQAIARNFQLDRAGALYSK